MKRIHFEDHGQDFLSWDIDENGTIIKSGPFQDWVWKGKVVKMETLKVGQKLSYISHGVYEMDIRYPVEKIEEIN